MNSKTFSQAEIQLETATIKELGEALGSGALTSETLLKLYLARIAAYDKKGPNLNSIIVLNPKAMEIARRLDEERKAKGPRGPLHGIPVVVKDTFDTFDMPTTGGFIGLAKSIPPRDSAAVKKLRDAGAIILAKTNLSDWFGERKNPLAWSTIAGQVLNPYDPTRVPGYSSAGTGAALAAYFAAAGLGSDTGGSVLIPAADSSLVGLLPTPGLMSRAGMIGSSFTQERGGPMGRSVYDVALLFDHLVGYDSDDMITARSLGKLPAQPYTSFLDANGLKGARIGILRDMYFDGPQHQDGLKLAQTAIDQMRRAGAIVVDRITTGINIHAAIDNASLSNFERYEYYNHYLARLGPNAPVRSVEEMIEKAPDTISRNVKNSLKIGPIDRNPSYLAARANQDMLLEIITGLIDRYKLDALVFPYKTVIAPKVGEDRPAGSVNRLASYAALPSLLVPAGFTSEGLPISMQFLGKQFSEPTLIKLGYAYEQISKNRKTPKTTPALEGEVIKK